MPAAAGEGGSQPQLAQAKVALHQLAFAHACWAALEGAGPCTSTTHLQAVH